MRNFVLFFICAFLACAAAAQKNSDDSFVIREDWVSDKGYPDYLKIKIRRFDTNFNPAAGFCFVHTRAAFAPNGRAIMTSQILILSGMDDFKCLYTARSSDSAKTWSEFRKSKNIERISNPDGTEKMFINATPFFHKKSNKFLCFGEIMEYGGNKTNFARGTLPPHRNIKSGYIIFDENSGEWSEPVVIKLPNEEIFHSFVTGGGQYVEEPNGDMLIPISCSKANAQSRGVCILKFSFDGKEFKPLKRGDYLKLDVKRGFVEPSIISHAGKYYLFLRNDDSGYVLQSPDGLKWEEPVKLMFDNDSWLGNYNTQAHWIGLADKLFLVYTRKDKNNEHVFRNRAPLFIAQFDTEKMRVIQNTEKIAVPERGARLGNFSCNEISENKWAVVATEWMQGPKGLKGCMEYGSNNAIFISEISIGSKAENK